MTKLFSLDTPIVTIGPGEYFSTNNNTIIKTLLGSCVAICLYDSSTKIIGMNHFLLASDRLNRTKIIDSKAGYFGLHAMELLINSMLKLGAVRKNFEAKIFGGANVLLNKYRGSNSHINDIGDNNIAFADVFLQQENIPIRARDVGGFQGRVIYFDNDDFSVYRKLIGTNLTEKLKVKEQRYFINKKQEINKPIKSVHFWDKQDN